MGRHRCTLAKRYGPTLSFSAEDNQLIRPRRWKVDGSVGILDIEKRPTSSLHELTLALVNENGAETLGVSAFVQEKRDS